MLEIDGSRYSGSGTIARQAVMFAALTGQAVHIVKARVRRPTPGLRPQHIRVVEAIRQVVGGQIEGVEVGAQELTFRPATRPRGQQYLWDIGSAGSTTMLALAVLPVLAWGSTPVSVELRGGVFQDFAPSVYHVQHVVLPLAGGTLLRCPWRTGRWYHSSVSMRLPLLRQPLCSLAVRRAPASPRRIYPRCARQRGRSSPPACALATREGDGSLHPEVKPETVHVLGCASARYGASTVTDVAVMAEGLSSLGRSSGRGGTLCQVSAHSVIDMLSSLWQRSCRMPSARGHDALPLASTRAVGELARFLLPMRLLHRGFPPDGSCC